MPADAAIVSAAIVSVFALFAMVLYWGERRTRSLEQSAVQTKRRAF